MAQDIHQLTATALAAQIREGAVSAQDALEASLARVDAHNPKLNAVIIRRDKLARAKAKAADEAHARGDILGPLHGVPMTVKESFDLAGHPTTWGVKDLLPNVATQDAVAVRRLENAGAIVFGKTNVPEYLSDWQSFNEIYGTTNNPWDITRTPGGSSGGAATALAARMSFLELGSDIGASIRNPAHYCGVFGHKPTFGAVPVEGHLLPGAHVGADISVAGPLARSADDLDLALSVVAGPHGRDAAAWRLALPDGYKTDPKHFRVGVMLEDPACAQDDALTSRLSDAIDALAKAGVRVDAKARPAIDTERVSRVYTLMLRAATGARLPQAEIDAARERDAKRAPDDWSYSACLDRAYNLSHRDWLGLNNERAAMRAAWDAFFEDYDALLCPTASSTAFLHDHEGERANRVIPINGGSQPVVDQLFWAGLSCLVYLPGTVAPVGLARDGLPCGIQIVTNAWQDRVGIAFARIVERVLGGFTPPPLNGETS